MKPPASNGLEINKPPGGLIVDLQYFQCFQLIFIEFTWPQLTFVFQNYWHVIPCVKVLVFVVLLNIFKKRGKTSIQPHTFLQ